MLDLWLPRGKIRHAAHCDDKVLLQCSREGDVKHMNKEDENYALNGSMAPIGASKLSGHLYQT